MREKFRMHLLWACALPGLAACATEVDARALPLEIDEKEQQFRTGWHGAGHGEITHAGLSFLKDGVRAWLEDANESVDGPLRCDELSHVDWFLPDCGSTKLDSTFHVDNCRVGESFDSLNDRYRALVARLDPAAPDFGKARKTFGSILHTSQDFFAHSNWVDAGRSALLTKNGFLHASTSPGSFVGDMIVAATPLPSGFQVRRSPGSRVPEVWNGQGWYSGLITGTYADNEDPSICPPEASIPHGDPFYQGGSGSYLAKDDPDSVRHAQAVDIAIAQTSEEFCRLVRLVTLRYGAPGNERLLTEWVGSRAGYSAKCPNDLGIVTSLIMVVL